MSERRFDDSPAPEDERALREAWQGDTPPAPDAALDARVRAAVEVELAAGAGAAPAPTGATVIRPARWQRLRVPLALAATVLLSFGAIRVMFPTAVAPQPMTPEREQAAASAPMRPENDAVQGAAPLPLEPAPAKPSAPRAAADAPPMATEFRAAPRPNAERQRQAAGVEATQPAPRATSRAAAPAAPPVAADAAPAGAAPAAKSALGALRDAPPAAFMHKRAAPLEAQAPEASSAQGADPRAEASESPAAALVRIRAQLGRGERSAARRALEEWVKAHPQAELPDWARALLAEETRVLP